MLKQTLIVFMLMALTQNTLHNLSPDANHERITAHRGSSRLAPENSVKAVKLAVREGAGMVEIDARPTKDGMVVLSHDDTVRGKNGIRLQLSQSSYKKAKKLLPSLATLDEIMRIAQKENIGLNIEIKTSPYRVEVPLQIAACIRKYRMQDRVVVSSFDEMPLKFLHTHFPDIKTGIIIGNRRQSIEPFLRNRQYAFISMKAALVNRQIVQKVHRHGKKLYVWTVNDEKTMRKMLSCNVDSIITDRPQILRAILFP